MPEIPHIAFPPRLAGTRLLTHEQDSPEEVKQCVVNLLRTPLGWSDEEDLQGMGLAGQVFRRGGPDLAAISAQIGEFEPRVDLDTDDVTVRLNEDGSIADINVRLTNPGA